MIQRVNLAGLLPLLEKAPGYADLVAMLRAGSAAAEARRPVGLVEAVRPFVTAGLFQATDRPLLVVVPGTERAQEYVEQLQTWLPDPGRVLLYPAMPHLPYQRVATDPQILGMRLQVLARLYLHTAGQEAPVIVASARALVHRTLPPWDFEAEVQVLKRGDWIALTELVRALHRLGYQPAAMVAQPGQFSRRGGILDVFPPADEQPLRFEFFGDEIESIRRFDVATQRSNEVLQQVVITPAHEALPLRGPQVARELEALDLSTLHPLAQGEFQNYLDHLAQAQAFPAIGLFQPLLHPEAATLLDYFPAEGNIIVDDWGQLDAVADQLASQAEIQRDEQEAAHEIPRGFTAPPYASWVNVRRQLLDHQPLVLGHDDGSLVEETAHPAHRIAGSFHPSPRYGGQLKDVVLEAIEMMEQSHRVVIISRQAPRVAELFEEWGIYLHPQQALERLPKPGTVTLLHGSLSEGWIFDPPAGTRSSRTVVLSDGELFGWRIPKRRRQPRRRSDVADSFFSDVAVGEYVVHIEHGIGIYRGLVKLEIGESEREYLVLEYDRGDKLYVPTYQVDRVARYVGVGDRPPKITRLGTADWERVKQKAKKAVEDIAKELLMLYAQRESVKGHAFGPDTSWQAALEAAFPHVETEDQLRAIEEIKRDMESDRVMDRLLVGDVGFGKTEVALRTAFKAVMDGKQVALLVPTTVLAQQHYKTFEERLRPFPIEVEMLSRFRTPAQQREILKRLEQGEIDIIIGTHRLLQKDVKFHDLGLLIIDEEHRFGVKAKERLKQLRTQLDVLSMTATPIPRTLHMSLTGVRDMSTIDTPPDERLPVTTQVTRWDDEIIRRAILRELSRGGQVFFVHNRVATIEHIAQRLRRLVPEATFAVAHGQMNEDQLAERMLAFAAGEIDVLVCTSIIESGLDIQNANTLIVDRADTFGLAQLYQLRGRVGRGAQQAYAYFLYDKHKELPEDAHKRLQTLVEATDLGAGFRIAMRDLEIRGAGDLLGARQHGHISAVGFDLYTRLLAQAIKELRADDTQRTQEPAAGADVLTATEKSLLPTIELPIDAYLPEHYVPEEHIRLRLYRRMSEVGSLAEVRAMHRELKDRFGELPPEAENLLHLLRLKVLAKEAGVQYVAREGRTIVMKLADAGPLQRSVIKRRFNGRLRVGRDQIWVPVEEKDSPWWQDLEQILQDLAKVKQSR